MMKLWVAVVLIVFIAVAGYQFGFYHGKLTASTAEKVRLNTLLTRERSHAHEDLQVMKGLSQQEAVVTATDTPKVLAGASLPVLNNTEAESELIAYLRHHPHGQTLTVHAFACVQDHCEFSARYAGKTEDFTRLLHDLQQQSWWQYREAARTSSVHNGIEQIDVTFTTGQPVVKHHLG